MSLHHRLNNLFQRFKLTGLDDSGPLQKVKGQGRALAAFGGQRLILRFQQAGLSAVPSDGEGMVFCLNGNPDQAIVPSLENPAKRPTGQADGETTLYAEFDNTVKLDKDGNIIVTAGAGQLIKLVGNVEITGWLHVDGEAVTHAGINIGNTHTHADPQGGEVGPPH